MAKAQDAFRTISEVSETLDTPTHVLRFWESKFTQIKPVKRAGGRRYYRPDDLALLSGIKDLLHEQGMTIKGAQKLLREKGVKHVVALGQSRLNGDVVPQDTNQETNMVDVTPSEVTQETSVKETVEAAIAEDALAPQAAAPQQTTLFSAPSAADPVAADKPQEQTADAEPQEPRLTVVRQQNDAPEVKTAPDAQVTADAPDAPEDDAPQTVADEGGTETATPDPVKMPPAAPITFPQIAEPKDVPARFFGSLKNADIEAVHNKSAQIAPLVARLEKVRDRLRRV